MAKNLQLRENRLDEENGIYQVVINSRKTTEDCSLYNLTALEKMKADVRSEKTGFFHVALLEKNTGDFEDMRILLAGVKNQEIYFPEIIKDDDGRGFTVDIRPLIENLEHGRNKSVRILLETVEHDEYHRYHLMDDKKAEQDSELQSELKNWICVSPCTDTVLMTDEEGENEKFYTLATYMDRKGKWFLSFCTESRIESETKISHLRRFSIRKGKIILYLKLEADRNSYEMERVVFRFRNKLKEQQEEYDFDILQSRTKGRFTYVKVSIDIPESNLKSLYWDVVVRYKRKDSEETYDSFLSMGKALRYFTAFFYTGSYKGKDNFFMYPYNTGTKKLAFQYREKGECDTLGFRFRESIAFILFHLLKPYWKSKHIKLVYEKFCMMAQDNGYYFFKYCMENKEEERQNCHIYYVITKDAADRKKLEPYKDHVIDFMSIRHMIYMQAAELLISTDTRSHLYAIRQRGTILKRAIRKKPLVFLQHGVTALKRVDFLYGKGKSGSCDLFVVTSDFEKKIVEENFGYAEDEIVNSGFARWDVLEDKSEGLREILIMPTWRSWLENQSLEEFKENEYFLNYMKLLNSERFHEFLKKNNLQANFYLHSKFKDYISDFTVEDERIRLIAFGEEPANELMMRCKMLVTDYSSVSWDVFYLDKPVVFFQFDREKYEEAHGSYLDMDTELFGDCARDVEGLLDYLEEYAGEEFHIKPQYEKMRLNFYKYFDDQNSRRICDAIVKKWPGNK